MKGIIRDKAELRKMWKEEERKKRLQAKIDEAKAASPIYDGPATAEEELAKSDWEKLTTIAKLKFPEHLAAKYNLKPNERVANIAYMMGWSVAKIALAASVAETTVYKWLNKEEAKDFTKAFNYHTGQADSKEILDSEMYQTLRTICEIRDDVTLSASSRLDAAKWLWEQKYGKAKESREIKSVNLRDLTEQLGKAQLEEESAMNLLEPTKPNDPRN